MSPHTVSITSLLPFKPCQRGWRFFRESFPNLTPDQPISITELLDNGIPVPDVIWALRGLPESSLKQAKNFAIDLGKSALTLFEADTPGDTKPRKALEAAIAYLAGQLEFYDVEEAIYTAYLSYPAFVQDSAHAVTAAARAVTQTTVPDTARYIGYAASSTRYAITVMCTNSHEITIAHGEQAKLLRYWFP